jgi:hypothetical protein
MPLKMRTVVLLAICFAVYCRSAGPQPSRETDSGIGSSTDRDAVPPKCFGCESAECNLSVTDVRPASPPSSLLSSAKSPTHYSKTPVITIIVIMITLAALGLALSLVTPHQKVQE